MAIRKVAVQIGSGGTVTPWIAAKDIGDGGTLSIVGVATPGTVDAVALSIEFSLDGSTALAVTNEAGTAQSIVQAANTYVSLQPANYPVVPAFFRLKAASAVAAARNYTVVLRDIT